MQKCTLSLNGIIKSCLETSTNLSQITNTIGLRPKDQEKSQGNDQDPKIHASRKTNTIAVSKHMTSKSTATNMEEVDNQMKSQIEMVMMETKVIGVKMMLMTLTMEINPTSK